MPLSKARRRSLISSGRTGLAIVLLAVTSFGAACSSSSSAELQYIDELRNRYPDLSVSSADDDSLVAAGRATCAGEDVPELARLEQIGVDRQVVAEIAVDTICPAR